MQMDVEHPTLKAVAIQRGEFSGVKVRASSSSPPRLRLPLPLAQHQQHDQSTHATFSSLSSPGPRIPYLRMYRICASPTWSCPSCHFVNTCAPPLDRSYPNVDVEVTCGESWSKSAGWATSESPRPTSTPASFPRTAHQERPVSATAYARLTNLPGNVSGTVCITPPPRVHHPNPTQWVPTTKHRPQTTHPRTAAHSAVPKEREGGGSRSVRCGRRVASQHRRHCCHASVSITSACCNVVAVLSSHTYHLRTNLYLFSFQL